MHTTHGGQQPERLLTARELADHLGSPVSWIYNNRNRLPHFRLGREYRFRLSEINAHLETLRQGPSPLVA
jgi:excisionase family DNA binding protein